MTRRNIIRELCRDHEEVRKLFAQVESAQGKRREEVFHRLVGELVRHEVAEEEILRPVSKRDAGERIANARLKEESKAEELLKKLEGLDPDSSQFDQLLTRLHTAVEQHAESEETKEFPRVEAAESPEWLEKMATAYEVAKETAPTHPHPSTPNTPMANLLVGPFVAVADRARDAVQDAMRKAG